MRNTLLALDAQIRDEKVSHYSRTQRGGRHSRGCGDGEPADRRGSVPRFPCGRRGGDHPSVRSTWGDVAGPALPRFDLAPGGGCRAAEVALDAGALLPHRFTLACAPVSRGHRRSALCCPVPTGRPALALASTLALRSPDLPRRGQATPRSPGRLTVPTSLARPPPSATPPHRRRRARNHRTCDIASSDCRRKLAGCGIGGPTPSTCDIPSSERRRKLAGCGIGGPTPSNLRHRVVVVTTEARR